MQRNIGRPVMAEKNKTVTTNPKHATIIEDCGCVFCKNNRDFNLPESLVEACIKGEVVIFAGAGISTESRSVYPSTLYEDVAYDLDIKPSDNVAFSELMSIYIKKYGRRSFLQKVKKRFDYVDSFQDLRWAATRFHKELSTIPQIRDIVTTNWDNFFEEETGATPIITTEDYVFWDLPGRKVFKIHGSMSNIGTLVATKEDYNKCYGALSKGTIGASLKHMLATKTLVFIGYSFRDEDFQKIYSLIQKEMGDIIPQSFVVTTSEDTKNLAENSMVIRTDGRYFIEHLKNKLVEKGAMLADERFASINNLYFKVRKAHLQIIKFDSFSKYPELVYTASYQDGLMHALERVQSRLNTGEYSDESHLSHMIHSYSRLLKGAIRAKKYFDAAYIEGYTNGLLASVMDSFTNQIPIFYLYGYKDEIKNFEDLKVLLSKGFSTKSSLDRAERMMKKQVGNFQPVHTPFLDGVEPI